MKTVYEAPQTIVLEMIGQEAILETSAPDYTSGWDYEFVDD